ncbi:hypothetical protein [Frankia sp. Cas8]|uniref:hypothetical protein n=1 Tax=unclassified Frankia TaxID=2632575 RepID=UPI003A0FB81C
MLSIAPPTGQARTQRQQAPPLDATKAGIKPALVHFYFRTMDDLFLAVFRHGAQANLRAPGNKTDS